MSHDSFRRRMAIDSFSDLVRPAGGDPRNGQDSWRGCPGGWLDCTRRVNPGRLGRNKRWGFRLLCGETGLRRDRFVAMAGRLDTTAEVHRKRRGNGESVAERTMCTRRVACRKREVAERVYADDYRRDSHAQGEFWWVSNYALTETWKQNNGTQRKG